MWKPHRANCRDAVPWCYFSTLHGNAVLHLHQICCWIGMSRSGSEAMACTENTISRISNTSQTHCYNSDNGIFGWSSSTCRLCPPPDDTRIPWIMRVFRRSRDKIVIICCTSGIYIVKSFCLEQVSSCLFQHMDFWKPPAFVEYYDGAKNATH